MSAKNRHVDENVVGIGGAGSNDANSGGGAGSGVPDAETAARTGEEINKGDVALDRQRVVGDVATIPSHKKVDPG